ncbi:MAG: hypothetical protein ACYTG0_41855 [Planctomycetota bacterium]
MGTDANVAGVSAAKQVILPLIRNPATADFPWENVATRRIGDLKSYRWSVTGVVNAQNDFGVVKTHQWQVIVFKRSADSDYVVSEVFTALIKWWALAAVTVPASVLVAAVFHAPQKHNLFR